MQMLCKVSYASVHCENQCCVNKSEFELSFCQGDRETSPQGGGRHILCKYTVWGSEVDSMAVTSDIFTPSLTLLSVVDVWHACGHSHSTNQSIISSMHRGAWRRFCVFHRCK